MMGETTCPSTRAIDSQAHFVACATPMPSFLLSITFRQPPFPQYLSGPHDPLRFNLQLRDALVIQVSILFSELTTASLGYLYLPIGMDASKISREAKIYQTPSKCGGGSATGSVPVGGRC